LSDFPAQSDKIVSRETFLSDCEDKLYKALYIRQFETGGEDRDAASTVRDGGSKSGGSGTRRTSLALAGIKKSENSFSWIESLRNHERDRFQMLRAGCGRKIGFYPLESACPALETHDRKGIAQIQIVGAGRYRKR
jgi:hypothetical protein